ncbi:MAG: hemolysin family protein [Nocardioidaceae bacterium]
MPEPQVGSSVTAAILVVVSLLLVAAAGIFVAAEFAFVTVDRSAVERDANAGDPTAKGLQSALKQLSTQLSGAQVGITVTNLAIGYLAEPAIATLVDGPLEAAGLPAGAVYPTALGLGLFLSSIVTILFGELVPKNLAIARPMETARATQGFQRAFTAVSAWPIRFLNGSANAVVRRLGIEPQEELRSARSSTELASLIARSADLGTLDAQTAELFERSVEFGTRTAGEIMTPRVRTHSLDETDRASAVIEMARETGHSRFPVLDAEDGVVGTVHVKHAVALPVSERATTRIKHIMVKPIVVPDSLRLDPAGAAARGRLPDGHRPRRVRRPGGRRDDGGRRRGDRRRHRRRARPSRRPVAPAPRRVMDLVGVAPTRRGRGPDGGAAPEHEDYDTIAGLVLQQLGRIPVVGDVAEVSLPVDAIEEDDDDEEPERRTALLRVEAMEGLRIDRLRLSVRIEAGEQA